MSATQAGLSRSWVNRARLVDAALDARVRAAREAAAARLGAYEENRPAEAWRTRRGVPLVVTRRGQVARAPGARRWTKRMEERFLVAIMETRNLEIAAPAVGMSVASLEKHRRRWPAFDRRVREALRLSAGALATRLVVPVDEEEEGMDVPDPALSGWPAGMTLKTAIDTLRRHKAEIDVPEGTDALMVSQAEHVRACFRAWDEERAAVRARIAELRAGQAERRAERAAAGSDGGSPAGGGGT